MIKYSILVPYYNRMPIFHNTLVSFQHHYSWRQDYELILVEDIKNLECEEDHQKLIEAIEKFKGSVPIKYFTYGSKEIYNPVCNYNFAASKASGMFYIITNPECFHHDNILAGLDLLFYEDPEQYVVCSCIHWESGKLYIDSFDELQGYMIQWYQHTLYRNAQYHFCNAISSEHWNKLGGFDEDFKYGVCRDDNDFLERIRQLNITINSRDDLLVKHLAHRGWSHYCKDWKHRITINQELYFKKHGHSTPEI